MRLSLLRGVAVRSPAFLACLPGIVALPKSRRHRFFAELGKTQ